MLERESVTEIVGCSAKIQINIQIQKNIKLLWQLEDQYKLNLRDLASLFLNLALFCYCPSHYDV